MKQSKIFKLFPIILSMIFIAMFTLTACRNDENQRNPEIGKNGSIDITYYKGGTGDEWIEDLAMRFEDLTLIKVNLTSDANATKNAKTLLSAGRNLPDIMFLQYTNWREYVQKDWIIAMDDLYDGTFEYEINGNTITSSYSVDGTKTEFFTNSGETQDVTLKDIIVEDFNDYGYMAKTVKDEKRHYIIPWTCPSTGIAYNVKMLKEVGYNQPPKDEAELRDLVAKLNAKGYTPFSWGGTEIKYWDFVVFTWWAQASGVDAWKAFYEFESAEVFADPGRVKALKLWQDLIVNPQTGEFINSISAPMGRDHMSAQTQFVAGNAAMTPTGAWLENEVGEFIMPGFEFEMMPVPAIEGAKTGDDGKPVQVLNTEAGSFACIPSGTKNADAAKAFLAFMNSPENVEKFSEFTGQPRPFNYYPSKLDNLSPWNKSCYELYETSERMWRTSSSPIYTYAGINEWPYYGGVGIYGNLAGADRQTPQYLCDYMYDFAVRQWPTWQKAAGIG